MTLQVAAHEAVLTSAHFQRRGAGLVDTGGAVFLGQRQHAQNASYGGLAVLAVHAAAERADLLAGLVGAGPAVVACPLACAWGGLALGCDGRRGPGAGARAVTGRWMGSAAAPGGRPTAH